LKGNPEKPRYLFTPRSWGRNEKVEKEKKKLTSLIDRPALTHPTMGSTDKIDGIGGKNKS